MKSPGGEGTTEEGEGPSLSAIRSELALRTSELHEAIEERRRIEEHLRASEARYRGILETAGEGIWSIDARALTSFVNPKMEAMLGYDAGEMLGKSLFDFMDDENRLIATRNVSRRREGIAEHHEFKFRRKDGSQLLALLAANPLQDADGAYCGSLAMVTDITEQRQNEEVLRASEERFRAWFEHSPNALWEEDGSELKVYFDALDRAGTSDFRSFFEAHPEEIPVCLAKVKVLDVNPAAVVLYEARDKAELIDGLALTITPESFGVFSDELIALGEGKKLFEAETTTLTLGGKKKHILLRAQVAPGSEIDWKRVYVSIVDITSHKQLEEKLRQSQKMEAIGQLSAGVAHDFNNFLAIIKTNTGLLQRPEIGASDRERALADIIDATDRAGGLTRQLLTVSRRQRTRLRRLDLNESIRALEPMLGRLVGDLRSVRHESECSTLFIDADAAMIDQVIMNLVLNARDAMPEGGPIIIDTARFTISDGGHPSFPDANPGSYASLRISDAGVGIDDDALSRVLEPFFTTKGPGMGTGLGLAIVFGIVKQHGGALEIASERGVGTKVTVLIPTSR